MEGWTIALSVQATWMFFGRPFCPHMRYLITTLYSICFSISFKQQYDIMFSYLLQGWGFTVILGIHAAPTTLPFHPMELFNGRGIIGSVFGGFKGKSQLPHFAIQCMRGVSRIPLISTSFSSMSNNIKCLCRL